jgi:CHAD domain-containing protein
MAHATTGIPGALARAVRRDADALAHALARARRADDRGVHRARVASRRLREALPIASAITHHDVRALERDMRRLTRALGGVREMDVARGVLRDLSRSEHARPPAVARVDRECARIRDRRARAMAKKLAAVNPHALAARLTALAHTLDRAALKSAAAAFIASRLRQRARSLERALEAAGSLYAAEPLHAVRIAAKKLRYALELARDVKRARIGRDLLQIKRLQSDLGDIHDLQIVQQTAQRLASRAGVDRESTRQLEDLAREIETRCRERHGRFLKVAIRTVARADLVARDMALRFLSPRSARMARMTASRPLAPAMGVSR